MDETENINSAQLAARQRLSANMKVLRGKRELSQDALADRAGLHRTYISQVERQLVNVSLDNLVLLAVALGVSVTELLVEPSEAAIPVKPGRKRTSTRAER
ncbi:helix-turn-helix domain-containing protein [Cupriavidus lacunae]|uniref:XRE family transcriptional regulator n=1 Tax=Cupriavidus lacunae TaxID=2666307 RepID=A0A370P213_9BURK|nr:helix-turn-helix transcriptional regulator [Cupriavidus lacunae]RDK11886.1 XRE family transcriptional regulator [Cupriavidus lacunae]